MRVPKFLLPAPKKLDFGPKNGQIWPKTGILGQISAFLAHSQDTYLLYKKRSSEVFGISSPTGSKAEGGCSGALEPRNASHVHRILVRWTGVCWGD